MKPRLAISFGDPSGIGPEIIAANLKVLMALSSPTIFGHEPTWADVLHRMGEKATATGYRFVHAGPGSISLEPGSMDAAGAQFSALEAAVDSVTAGECDALVTAPVSKTQISRVSPGFTGHTEYLAGRAGLQKDDVTMVFVSDLLAVGLLATHVPMRGILETIKPSRYLRTARHLTEILTRLHPGRKPRLAVAALNPHGGEDGLLGSEEKEIIEPACRAIRESVDAIVSGPLPADTVFRNAMAGEYDGVIAAYHDQAMIPLKLMGPGRTVNVTMGLPYFRTSPDHGVAYDLARTGRADPAGMGRAIEVAVRIQQ